MKYRDKKLEPLTFEKKGSNLKNSRGKSFGYQILGFGSGGVPPPAYVTATGGTVTTSGDFKFHVFTGPGTFCVSCGGNPGGNDKVDYLVIAGGGSGGVGSSDIGGSGGGAGGYRESHCSSVSGCYTASPLATPSSLTVSAGGIPVTVGGGGTSSSGNVYPGVNAGSNSVFSSITSAC